MENEWKKMFDLAKSKMINWEINRFIDVGGVSACIRTTDGEYYTGVCFDTSASLGMCAERNAIAQMLNNQKNKIDKIVCIDENDVFMTPCGVCRELIKMLEPKTNGKAEFLLNLDPIKTITLDELLPKWWGAKYGLL